MRIFGAGSGAKRRCLAPRDGRCRFPVHRAHLIDGIGWTNVTGPVFRSSFPSGAATHGRKILHAGRQLLILLGPVVLGSLFVSMGESGPAQAQHSGSAYRVRVHPHAGHAYRQRSAQSLANWYFQRSRRSRAIAARSASHAWSSGRRVAMRQRLPYQTAMRIRRGTLYYHRAAYRAPAVARYNRRTSTTNFLGNYFFRGH